MSYCCTIDIATRPLGFGPAQLPLARLRLLELARLDQLARQAGSVPPTTVSMDDWLGPDRRRADELLRLRRWCGPLTAERVGMDGCRAAWFIAKHAGLYRGVAPKLLVDMQRQFAADPRQTFAVGIPYLIDAILLECQQWADGAVQLFGTAEGLTLFGADGVESRSFAVVDVAGLVRRRAAYGLLTTSTCVHREAGNEPQASDPNRIQRTG